MTNLKNVRYAMSVLAAIAAFGMVTEAKAQTATVDVDVSVQNTVTLNVSADMNFGTIVAIGDAAETASIAIGTDDVLGAPATTGAPAYIAVSNSGAASRGQIEVTDGATGATINLVINNLVQPTDGTSAFALGTFQTSWNGGAPSAQVVNTPWTRVLAAGTNILNIGATLSTVAGQTYANGAYDGGFDVVFSY